MYYIYLIPAITDNLKQWKIGLTKNPPQRLKQLKTANPNLSDFYVLYEITDRVVAYKTEAFLKKDLKQFRIEGEWYVDYSLNDILFIEYCKDCEIRSQIMITIKNNLKNI